MGNRSASMTVPGLLLPLFASLELAQPAAALYADYWQGGSQRRSGTSWAR